MDYYITKSHASNPSLSIGVWIFFFLFFCFLPFQSYYDFICQNVLIRLHLFALDVCPCVVSVCVNTHVVLLKGGVGRCVM